MKKNNNNSLLQFCRYYKGEKENPYALKGGYIGFFWDYERVWVRATINAQETNSSVLFDDMLEEYIRSGLATFQQTDNTPVTLKALLYNRYGHWSGLPMLENAEPFKKWYLHEYLGEK